MTPKEQLEYFKSKLSHFDSNLLEDISKLREHSEWLTIVQGVQVLLTDESMPDTSGLRERLLLLHYEYMANPRFWYNKELMDKSRKLCGAASVIRKYSA